MLGHVSEHLLGFFLPDALAEPVHLFGASEQLFFRESAIRDGAKFLLQPGDGALVLLPLDAKSLVRQALETILQTLQLDAPFVEESLGLQLLAPVELELQGERF